jgi:O-antigen/teichoic acid export membrane protein
VTGGLAPRSVPARPGDAGRRPALLRRLWGSPTLRVTPGFCLGGVGFALGNLLLARALPTTQYALFALMLALVQIGMPLAPAGADVVVNRHRPPSDGRLLLRALATSLASTVLTLAAALLFYELEPWLLALAAATILAGGPNLVAAAQFQRRERFALAVLLVQGQNAALFLAALLALAAPAPGAVLPAAVLALGCALSATLGWTLLRRGPAEPGGRAPYPWRESLSAAGVQASALVLIQMERLVIPKTLDVADLATFAVAAAIVGSPFRMLQLGVGYTLVSRLRNAISASERRRLVGAEARGVLALVAAACGALWFATPFLVEILVGGKYVVSASLVLAMLVSGLAKVLGAFATAVVNAAGSPRDLLRLNLRAWLALVVGAAAAVVGSRFGLAGVVYGAGLGWLAAALSATALAAPHLRRPGQDPGGTPRP